MPDSSDGSADPDAPPADLDPADAFALLGNATRLEIVTALHDEADGAVAFSTLFDRVDVDDSGQFNYHLDQLIPFFVRKEADAYALTAAGRRIARAVSAGRYTDRPWLEPFALEGECYSCGASALEGSYQSERFDVECGNCGVGLVAVEVPPSLVRGRDPEAFVDAFQKWVWTRTRRAVDGLCAECGGTVEASVEERDFQSLAIETVARYRCTVCGHRLTSSVGGVAIFDSTVEAFHRRRGDPLAKRPYWAIPELVSDETVEIVSRDPWRVRASFHADGDACHVTLDGDLDVVETTVVPGGAADS